MNEFSHSPDDWSCLPIQQAKTGFKVSTVLADEDGTTKCRLKRRPFSPSEIEVKLNILGVDPITNLGPTGQRYGPKGDANLTQACLGSFKSTCTSTRRLGKPRYEIGDHLLSQRFVRRAQEFKEIDQPDQGVGRHRHHPFCVNIPAAVWNLASAPPPYPSLRRNDETSKFSFVKTSA